MVRILLFVTVLALGGAFFVAFSNVQGKIDNLESSLAQTETDLQRTRGELTKAKTAQKEAEDKMADAQSKAETAVANLRNTQQALVAQRQRADQHEATSKDLQAQLVQATTFVESWRLFQQANGTQDQIRQKLAAYDEVDNQRAQFVAENGILLSQIEKQSVELSRYTGKSAKITLPRSLNGKITAVDAQFDFVVLDIGENQGAREHGELLVSRGEKLIGKLRILDVKKDHSIANILPDWKQEEVQTGDLVIVGN
jgi:chromosome segregation ATPase